jgi:ribonuclease R
MRRNRASRVDEITEAEVIRFVKSRRYRPMTVEDMADHFNVSKGERDAFKAFIHTMRVQGHVVKVKHNCLADPDRVDLVVGRLDCNPRGFGFVEPAREPEGEDIYVSGNNLSSAMHGDIVAVRAPGYGRGGHRRTRGGKRAAPEAKIVSIVQRARTHLVGTLVESRTVTYVVPDDGRLFRDVIVAAPDRNGARPKDKVKVRIETWPSRHINPTGVIVEVFGPRGQLKAERWSVIHAFDLRYAFPDDVLRAAKSQPRKVRRVDLEGRTDLTDELIITIDPEDARDFDDAISLRRLKGGRWELGVHIADVTHYVKEGDPIDLEAQARGTSVYLPGQVIPMLPEALSNHICSLRPRVRRLTKTVRMTFGKDGKLLESDVFRSVIKSDRRFTYKEVQAVLDGGSLPRGEKHLVEKLREFLALAKVLRKRRKKHGMLELEIPEARVRTDKQGRTTAIDLHFGDDAHRLIEQFMLAANEAVAKYLLAHDLPYLCRAHPEPSEKALAEFRDSARALGYTLSPPGNKGQLVRFFDRIKGKEEEHVLHYLFLRSMQRAEYAAKRQPHYAIGVTDYLHFTSPIRRHPDLIAHRILDDYWSGRMEEPGVRETYLRQMPIWMKHASVTERNAEAAEKTIVLRRMKEFLSTRTGPLEALIIAAEGYGLRVQTCETLVQGIVRISSLRDGFYRVDRRRKALVGPRGKNYRVGDTIRVRVSDFDELKYQIEFEVAE